MTSPTMTRGLFGHFLRGADPPATDQRASLPPVQFLTSFSLWAISVAGTRGRDAQGGASDRRSPWDGGGSILSPFLFVLSRNSVYLGGNYRGFVPPGQLVHCVGVDALHQLDSSSHSLAALPGVFRHSVGLAAPLPD